MSQVQSYNETYLANKVASIEQDVIQLKARQIYGMNDVQVFTSNELKQGSHTFTQQSYDHQYTWTASATNVLKVRFVGNKPSKTVVGILRYAFEITSQGDFYDVPFLKAYRGANPNVLEWLVCAYGGNDAFGSSYTTFNLKLTALTNEVGVLSIVDSYDIGTYYGWVLG